MLSRPSSAVQSNQCGLYANCGSGYLSAAAVSNSPTWKGSSSFLPWQKPAVSLNKTSREEFQLEKRRGGRKTDRERERREGKEKERWPVV